jgi:selenide,water dikinase
MVAAGAVPGGTTRNLEAAAADWAPNLTRAQRIIATDAQTSGGLLLSVPADQAASLLSALRAGPSPSAAIIGKIVAEPGLRVR